MRKKKGIYHPCFYCQEAADGNYLIILADAQLQKGKYYEGKEYSSTRAYNKSDHNWGVRKAFLEK